jgi:hypothetical protein
MRYCFIAALLLYWPFIFFLAHVPDVPRWILRTQMSDKTLHYLGYLILVFLWWFSVYPSKRPSFFSGALWFTIAMMIFYAAADEWLQRFTHRTPDIMDFSADMAGVGTGLVIFAAAGLHFSALAVTAAVIFILTSLCKTDPLGFVPIVDILFYAGAYGLVTLLWMNYLKRKPALSLLRFILLSLLVPVILLIVTSAVASIMRKHLDADRLIAASAGIIVPIIAAVAVSLCRPASKAGVNSS